jgi:hypothetical protein
VRARRWALPDDLFARRRAAAGGCAQGILPAVHGGGLSCAGAFANPEPTRDDAIAMVKKGVA